LLELGARKKNKEGQEVAKSARKRQKVPETALFLLELGALLRFTELKKKLELELQQQMTRAL
jgi:hypothetical protein